MIGIWNVANRSLAFVSEVNQKIGGPGGLACHSGRVIL